MRVAIIADIILLIKQSNEQAPHGIDAINATVIHSGDGLTVTRITFEQSRLEDATGRRVAEESWLEAEKGCTTADKQCTKQAQKVEEWAQEKLQPKWDARKLITMSVPPKDRGNKFSLASPSCANELYSINAQSPGPCSSIACMPAAATSEQQPSMSGLHHLPMRMPVASNECIPHVAQA